MDIALIVIGIIFITIGARRKDKSGARSGGGIALLIIGSILTAIGIMVIIFGTFFLINMNRIQREASEISTGREGFILETPQEGLLDGSSYVHGTIRNMYDKDKIDIAVTIILYDENGSIVESVSAFTPLIKSGSAWNFKAMVHYKSAKKYKVDSISRKYF